MIGYDENIIIIEEQGQQVHVIGDNDNNKVKHQVINAHTLIPASNKQEQ